MPPSRVPPGELLVFLKRVPLLSGLDEATLAALAELPPIPGSGELAS